MNPQSVLFYDLGVQSYKKVWDMQEQLLQENVKVKTRARALADAYEQEGVTAAMEVATTNYLLFVEHPPVFTLGKSGDMQNLLLPEEELIKRGIEFFKTNRGGDITFHGLQQVVGYPILDLEKFGTDIGRYLRNIEEVIIHTLADYGIIGERSAGETGVWIEPGIKGKERKICAIGVRCSRWITMHGFAFNINTDLSYFDMIIPCGIQNKQVTSLQKELGREIEYEEVKQLIKKNFEKVFDAELQDQNSLPM